MASLIGSLKGDVKYDGEGNILEIRHPRNSPDNDKPVVIFFCPDSKTDPNGIFSNQPGTGLRELIEEAQTVYQVWLLTTGRVEEERDLALALRRAERKLKAVVWINHGDGKRMTPGIKKDHPKHTYKISVSNIDQSPAKELIQALKGMIDSRHPERSVGITIACKSDSPDHKRTIARALAKRLRIPFQSSSGRLYPRLVELESLDPFRIKAFDMDSGEEIMKEIQYNPATRDYTVTPPGATPSPSPPPRTPVRVITPARGRPQFMRFEQMLPEDDSIRRPQPRRLIFSSPPVPMQPQVQLPQFSQLPFYPQSYPSSFSIYQPQLSPELMQPELHPGPQELCSLCTNFSPVPGYSVAYYPPGYFYYPEMYPQPPQMEEEQDPNTRERKRQRFTFQTNAS